MYKIQDLNPLYQTPPIMGGNGYPNSQSSGNHQDTYQFDRFGSAASVGPFVTSQSRNQTDYSDIASDDPSLHTLTNYYRFAKISHVNCCFYHVQKDAIGEENAQQRIPSLLQLVHSYDLLIKEQLSKKCDINDVITYVAKREICFFQIKASDSSLDSDQTMQSKSLQHLVDSIDNIVKSSDIKLKLLSSSTFSAETIFGSCRDQQVQLLQKKPMGIIYLSFLRAVKCFIIHQLSSWHQLFRGTTHTLSLEIVPFGNQMLTSSTIHSAVIDPSTSKERKRKQVAYHMLSVNPSLNSANELLVNFSTSKCVFYKLSDYLNLHCNNDIAMVDKDKSFAVYMCPSGVKCSFAIDGSFSKSLCDEPTSSSTILLKFLRTYSNIDLQESLNSQSTQARKWIRLMPDVNHVNGLTQRISAFTDQIPGDGRYIMWPMELCFIQFALDANCESDNTKYDLGSPFKLSTDFMSLFHNKTEGKELIEKGSEYNKPIIKSPMGLPVVENDAVNHEQDSLINKEGNDEGEKEENDDEDDEDLNALFGESDDSETNKTDNTNLGSVKVDEHNDKATVDTSPESTSLTTKANDSSSSHYTLSPRTSPLYQDPGAPAPIEMQIIDSLPTGDSKQESVMNTPSESSKSIFAPLMFNPLIKSDIDSKYSTGGKFFVKSENEESSDPSSCAADTFTTFLNPITKYDTDLVSDSDDDEKLGDLQVNDQLRKVESTHNNSGVSKHNFSHNIQVKSEGCEDDDNNQENNYYGGSDDTNNNNNDNTEDDNDDESEIDDFGDTEAMIHTKSLKQNVQGLSMMDSGLLASPVLPHASAFGSTMGQPAISDSKSGSVIFWVLRGLSTSTLPSHFLSVLNPILKKNQIALILPVLQEFLLYSQRDIQCEQFNSLVQERYGSLIPDFDIDFIIQRIFPGVEKTSLNSILTPVESDSRGKERGLFECLFGIYPPQAYNDESNGVHAKPIPDFDDPSFSSATPTGQHSQQPTPKSQLLQPATQEIHNIPSKFLFRIPSTVFNTRMLDKNITLNQTALSFWKLLGIQPVKEKKSFSLLIIYPKCSDIYYGDKVRHYTDSIREIYSSLTLGTISKSTMVEITGASDSENKFWNTALKELIKLVPTLQNQLMNGVNTMNRRLLVFFVTPFKSMTSILEMSKVCSIFQSALLTKKVVMGSGKKRRKLSSTASPIIRLPIGMFYKAISSQMIYSNSVSSPAFHSLMNLSKFAFQLYNLCPDGINLTQRMPFATIANEPNENIKFKFTKNLIAESLIEDDVFLHVCYEASIDKHWCTASWTDQHGSFTYIKSWLMGENSQHQHFYQIAEEIFKITMSYASRYSDNVHIVLSRLDNMIPDEELIQWKKLSAQHTDIDFIVLTIETEPSSLILSNNFLGSNNQPASNISQVNSSQLGLQAITPSVGITPIFPMTPAIAATPSTGHAVKYTSPEYGDITSPDISRGSRYSSGLTDGTGNSSTASQNGIADPELIDVSDECYGIIFPVSEPLSRQQIRLPLKTGFLVNTGLGNSKNRILEVNLLSCRPDSDSEELLKKLLIQFKNLSVLAPYYDILPSMRDCGDVNPIDRINMNGYDAVSGEETGQSPLNFETTEHTTSSKRNNHQSFVNQGSQQESELSSLQSTNNDGVNNCSIDNNTSIKKCRVPQQLQYHDYRRVRKLLQQSRSLRDYNDLSNYDEHPVIPPHILAVRKMLDFLVNLRLE